MKTDRWLVAASLVLAVVVLGALAVVGYRSARTPIAAVLPPKPQAVVELNATPPGPAPVAKAPDRALLPRHPASVAARPRLAAAPKPAGASRTPVASAQPASPPAAPIPLSVAREALTLVGADPMAEAVWVQAINDPDLSAHDRQDLIEDLNEEGFADPKNLTADDLPVIENRLALIEQLAPAAMDDVNAAAFEEAYKDLLEMHARLVPP